MSNLERILQLPTEQFFRTGGGGRTISNDKWLTSIKILKKPSKIQYESFKLNH